MVKIHTTGKNVDNSWNFETKDAFIMQNTGNLKFEASSKYVILKCRLIKTLLHTLLSLQMPEI